MRSHSGSAVRWRGARLATTMVLVALLSGGTAAFAVQSDTTGSVSKPATAVMAPINMADVVERVGPAVVSIQVQGKIEADQQDMEMPNGMTPDEFFRRFFGEDAPAPFQRRQAPQSRPMQGIGSGFLIDAEGHVITNNHVIEHADRIEVVLQDGTRLDAKLLGSDPKTDIALLKVESEEPLPFVSFGDSENVRVGEWVIAVGNPFGLGHTVTAGVLSARGRNIGAGPYDDFLQIDAPINRGNSGGPTFNLNGEVIGINAAIFSPSGGSIGIGFAIPSNIAKDVVAQLAEKGHVERGWLGVSVQTMSDDAAQAVGLDEARGALVADVMQDSPAAEAGIRPGDVILRIGGENIAEMRELPRLVAEMKAGREVPVVVWRDGEEVTLNATIARMEQQQQQVATATDAEPQSALGLQVREGPHGVVVTGMDPEGPAAQKGVQPGDVILSIGDREVSGTEDLVAGVALAKEQGRKAVLLKIKRQGQERFVAIPLRHA